MNTMQIFNNQQFGRVRVVDVKTVPYFVANDVCCALGYSNPRDAINRHVDSEDKTGVVIHDGSQNREMTAINESGVYSLVFGSKLPTAKQFKRWVTTEVLPSVRKHGAYLTDRKVEEVLSDPDTIIKLATQLKQERAEKERLAEENRLANEQIEKAAPMVQYYNKVLQSDSLITTNVIADQLGVSARRLNDMLVKRGIIYRQSDTYVLYAKYRGQGYEGYRTHTYISSTTGQQFTKQHLYWTEKGREFIYKLFQEGKKAFIPPRSSTTCFTMTEYEYTALDVIKRMGEDEVFRRELLLLINELLCMLKNACEKSN